MDTGSSYDNRDVVIMICEKILGTLDNSKANSKSVEYVDFDWEDAFKKLHKKVTDKGTEIGIRLDDTVLTRGIRDNDIFYEDGSKIIAARILPCKMIRVRVRPDHMFMTAKVCYEIGNRHAQLFYGDAENEFLTIYNEPMLLMLSKLHGVETEVITAKPDFEKRISSGAPGHHH